MVETGKFLVQVYGKKDKIIIFDFGFFAIVIEYVAEKDSKELILYSGDDYVKGFMGCVCKIIDENYTDTVIISIKDFEDIEKALGTQKRIERGTYLYKNLWRLLENNFSGYIKKYGF